MLILAVDDDSEDLSLLNEALTFVQPRARVLSAHDGLEALHLINELIVLPDLVFLDINMPGMDEKNF